MLLSMDDTLSAQGASKHVPVLLEATMEYLQPEMGAFFSMELSEVVVIHVRC